MTVGEFKTHFSEVLAVVTSGETVAVTFGKKKKIIGYFTSQKPIKKSGLTEGKAKAIFIDDFKMTEDEFAGL